MIANGLDNEGIRRSIGADTLGYVSLDGLIAATEQPKTRLCRACFDGEYPIDLPAENLIGKHVLEGVGRRVAVKPGAGKPRSPSAPRPSQPAWASAPHRTGRSTTIRCGPGRHRRLTPPADPHRSTETSKGITVTHVTERNGAASGPADGPAGGDRQPWTGGAGRGTRKRSVTYADAGVSIHAGDRAVELLKSKVRQTRRPEVVGDLGGFAGLFRLDTKKYRNPILASSTDGVGTKLVIAQQLDIHDTVGIDLVAMVVDDLVACGAEPLFLLDYIACGEVVPDKVAEIGAGIADGCRYAGCALLGGETAEHPGVLRPDEYDISATGVGVVEESDILGRERVEVGDVVIAMRSSGLHSNGYSLVRHVLLGVGPDAAGHRHRGLRQAAHPRRGAAHPDPDLRQGLPRPDRRGRGAGAGPRHRRRHPRQPGPRPAGARRRGRRPRHLAAAADLRPGPGARAASRTPRWSRPSTWASACSPIVSAEDADRALAFLTGRGVEAWQAGEIIEGTGNVQMVGSAHPGLITLR